MTDVTDEGNVLYPDLEGTIALYAILIEGTDQQAADQLRSRAGLASAIARPQYYALYQQADLALQAAALAHGIAEGQFFIDRNKRLALVSATTFLWLNGYDLAASEEDLAQWILDLSAGGTVEALAAQIRAALIVAQDM